MILNRLLSYEAMRLPRGRILCVELPELAAALPDLRDDVEVINFTTRQRAWLPPDLRPVNAVVMGFSPSKELVRMQLAMLAESIPEDTPLWLYGGGGSGIASAPKLLAADWSHVEKVGYGGHAELWRAALTQRRAAAGLTVWEKRILVEVNGEALRLVTLPGVFSHGELDLGTRLLLEHLPRLPEKARVLDFGCGAGVISAFLKQRQPSLDVHGTDISALALTAAKETLATNHLQATLHLEGDMSAISGSFGAIISNPPFHAGQNVDLKTALELIKSARKKLTKGGQLVIVANRFLPYKDALEAEFTTLKTLADTPQFRVLQAVNS